MLEKKKKPQILEVTLRDGSYALDFQFTANDTETICWKLQEAGVEMLEVGHGIGLGASRAGLGQAAESDESYMQAAAGCLQKAKWGMFCIPGIARLEDIDLAAEHGMDFVRVGTNAADVQESEPFIARAKRHGMFVAGNFMKSYTMPPAEFAAKAKQAQSYGADLIYIVDSAGGMLTKEMESYFRAVQEVCDVPLGFHGHNNLELAVANSLRAVELGAAMIDTSLQGIGRSAGNTPTEIFLMTLKRMRIATGIDALGVMDIGEKYIKPLMLNKYGYNSIDLVSGFAQFHSSYMQVIREISNKYCVDPRRLIIAVCREDKENAPRQLVEQIAQRMDREYPVYTASHRLDRYFGREQETGE